MTGFKPLFRILIICFVACGHAASQWVCSTSSDRIVIACQSDAQHSNNNVQFCCQHIKNGPFICQNASPFQTAGHRNILIETDEKSVDADVIASHHTLNPRNRLNRKISMSGINWDAWFQSGTSYTKSIGLQCDGINDAQHQPDHDPFIAVGGWRNGTSLTKFCYDGQSYVAKAIDVQLKVERMFASVVWHENILTVCGGQKSEGSDAGELLKSCEVIDFRGSSPQWIKYYENGFGTSGKSNAGLLYVNYMDQLQLINIGFLGLKHNRNYYNRTIRPFFLNDSQQQTFGPTIGHLTEECEGLIAFKVERNDVLDYVNSN